jgi:hypothetical protein
MQLVTRISTSYLVVTEAVMDSRLPTAPTTCNVGLLCTGTLFDCRSGVTAVAFMRNQAFRAVCHAVSNREVIETSKNRGAFNFKVKTSEESYAEYESHTLLQNISSHLPVDTAKRYCLIHPHINSQSPVHSRPGIHYETAYSLTDHFLYNLYLINMYRDC